MAHPASEAMEAIASSVRGFAPPWRWTVFPPVTGMPNFSANAHQSRTVKDFSMYITAHQTGQTVTQRQTRFQTRLVNNEFSRCQRYAIHRFIVSQQRNRAAWAFRLSENGDQPTHNHGAPSGCWRVFHKISQTATPFPSPSKQIKHQLRDLRGFHQRTDGIRQLYVGIVITGSHHHRFNTRHRQLRCAAPRRNANRVLPSLRQG